ncbi:MAG: hypothetical protein GWN18_05095 [Thermoplasmata archaeon]|nr:hypothetical protein [Thermoplasmata archaeon]NIS11406.1 hypothetical protein [Thermoplasmata archaeon]NIS19342.1 hypothetical protein [Thermoplasmata archaeon]NIT76435.1 hypothetical protein [Thermoplasmata archaeon]NIU48470.1 hypothetical protein [Thermoplasmata archaeon]
MPPEEESEPEDADQWAAEREERAPEFMEPVVEVDGDGTDEVDTGKDRKERDAASSTLYRERRIVEEKVEEEETPKPRRPTREERRALKEQRRLDREVQRMMRADSSRIRSSLAYKTFYDMVCNRVGVIIAGFGVAMILFTISYDWLQGEELSLGTRHWLALIISIAVYGLGMALEGMRILSPECEGLEARALRAQAAGEVNGGGGSRAEEPGPIPLIPEDALEKLNGNGR